MVSPAASVSAAAEDLTCKPAALAVVGADDSGALDLQAFERALGEARAFAERCCTGDESGAADVAVTLAPQGYETTVAVTPEALARGPTGACIHASFHRVTAAAFHGDPVTRHVAVALGR